MRDFRKYIPRTTRGAIVAGDIVEFCCWHRGDTAGHNAFPSSGPTQRGQVWSGGPNTFTVWVVRDDQTCVLVRRSDCSTVEQVATRLDEAKGR